MSQVFAADSVNGTASMTVPTSALTTVATGNFLNPPFGNAKAIVSGSVAILLGAGTTALYAELRRNPGAENALVASTGNVNAAAGNIVSVALQGSDVIPDGRPVRYVLAVAQASGTGNGTIQTSNVTAILISG